MVIIPAIIVYILFSIGLYKLAKRFTPKRWVHNIVIAVMVLIPTYDMMITYTFAGYYCISDLHPKTYIKHTVENPISIYWEDNVYPGYDENDTKLMIMNYLDGVHLKTMALNTPEGKVKIYTATPDDWNESQTVRENNASADYFKPMEQEAKAIMAKGITTTKQTMPKMNYTVTFNEVKLHPFARKFFYCDESKVIDNHINDVIAYNRRYMEIWSNFSADYYRWYYNQDAICGDWYEMHLKTFRMLKWRMNGLGDHQIELNKKLYIKYVKGEK